ncbi:MAG: DivIVA domain-containing protein [Deltaproteobacteria bacterium]|nr:DivIVA domain-containing protein [Deltaproteobacteria bacterium]MCD6138025.1 DivIVA domain-containing protein [Deltaproteobacteria bacterium]RLB90063.1 MAG: DivIVA domain-containing protein [Deltaproteobacteria bacterium]RLC08726.1 MAG: DivIVA domain-containing protein [Deltaproteobacteria bacterium]
MRTQITPLDIQQQQFRISFRGFNVREVDAFLERVAESLENLILENQTLAQEVKNLKIEVQEFRDREKAFRRAMVNAQKMLEDMKHNAEKEAELIISEARVKAEKILSSANNRLHQLLNDISELKTQRAQLEIEITSVLDAHAKLLNASKEASEAEEQSEEKLRFLKNA